MYFFLFGWRLLPEQNIFTRTIILQMDKNALTASNRWQINDEDMMDFFVHLGKKLLLQGYFAIVPPCLIFVPSFEPLVLLFLRQIAYVLTQTHNLYYILNPSKGSRYAPEMSKKPSARLFWRIGVHSNLNLQLFERNSAILGNITFWWSLFWLKNS